jgi:hypothetical protein
MKRQVFATVATFVCLLASMWAAPGSSLAGGRPVVSPPVQVVPSTGLPSAVKDNSSNNNVHTVFHGDRLFMVFRTARWHIASNDAKLYVVSSPDQVHWRFEGVFAYGRDLREARLLSWNGRLLLYFALLGSNPAAFQPGGTMATEYLGPGRWTTPRQILFDDFIPWAVKLHGGVPYMLGYTGGGGTFTPNPPPKDVYWLTTSDGFDWRPVDPARPVVYRGGCGETDFEFLADGSLVTACQTENKDALGWGAKICTAPAIDTARWTCRGDRRRLDSPFVFLHGADVYVLARRQPYFNGNYDLRLPAGINYNLRFAAYDALYAGTPKRCALWRIDVSARTFEPLLDIPGRGDTCYPSVLPDGPDRFLVYNYTSPLDAPDLPWGAALLVGPTIIYRTTLTFPS